MTVPPAPRARSTLFGCGMATALVLLALVAVAYYGRRLLARTLLDSADPEKQRAILAEATGTAEPPPGWTIARAFELGGNRVLLFEGRDGRTPVSLVAYTRVDAGKDLADRWIRAAEAPAEGVAYGLRRARRLSSGSVDTGRGIVPFAVIEGEDAEGLHQRAIYDLRGAGLPHPAEFQLVPRAGMRVDLRVGEEFVRALRSVESTSRPSRR